MRLICPNCDAHYEVGDDAIPESGRDVQCSACGTAWFQSPSYVRAETLSFPKPQAWQDETSEDDDFETDTPPGQTQAPAPPRKAADAEMLEVLRQEAAYEAKVRAREQAALESQPDLGLRASSAAPEPAAEIDPADEPAADPAQARKQAARRALPDIDDISSTLQPVTHPRRHAAGEDRLPPTEEAESRGFTTGFIMVTSAVLALTAVYVAAPALSDGIPALADVLERYTTTVDMMRIWVSDTVNALMQSATESLNGGSESQ